MKTALPLITLIVVFLLAYKKETPPAECISPNTNISPPCEVERDTYYSYDSLTY